MNNLPLLVASQSSSRHALLRDMAIDFMVIDHTSNEQVDTSDIPLEQIPLAVAQHKMAHVIIPGSYAHTTAFILTADTMGFSVRHNKVYGKPADKEQAREFLHALTGSNKVITAICVEKRRKEQEQWICAEHIHQTVVAEYTCSMDEHAIELYLNAVPQAMYACGAFMVDGYGAQFIQSIKGSYTAILGLPVYELRVALEQLQFYPTR